MRKPAHAVRNYLGMLVHSYNPDRYVKLMDERWRKYAKFFIATLLLAMILFVFSFIPMALKWNQELTAKMDHVETFKIDGTIEADGVVVLLDTPRIVLDLNDTGEDARLALTNEGIRYPTYLFFGKSFAKWDDLSDLKKQTSTRDGLLIGTLLFLLPSIIFWVAVWSLLKLFLVFLLLVMLGYTIPRFFKHRMRFSETVKAALLAMPSVTLFGVGLSPLAPRPLWWWGFCLTLGVFAVAVFILSERTSKRKG